MPKHNGNDEEQEKFTLLQLLRELPSVITHLAKAIWNYAHGRGFTDEP